jgi:hypothetical protein
MPRFEFSDPYSKRCLPDDFVSPAWVSAPLAVTSTSGSSGGGGGGVIDEEVFDNALLLDDGFVMTDDEWALLLFD